MSKHTDLTAHPLQRRNPALAEAIDAATDFRINERVTLVTDPAEAPGKVLALGRDGAGRLTRIWVGWDSGRCWVYPPEQLVKL